MTLTTDVKNKSIWISLRLQSLRIGSQHKGIMGNLVWVQMRMSFLNDAVHCFCADHQMIWSQADYEV